MHKNNTSKITQESVEDLYVATECICDDEGVHYICSSCGKCHSSDFEALMCCFEDVERE